MLNGPIADLWATYAERVIPAEAGPIHIQETRRAFYAGAHGLFQAIVNLSDDDELCMALMRGVEAEARAFCEAVKEGRL